MIYIFSKIDFGGTDRISQEEFRAAIESRFSFDMTDDQFGMFMDRVPLDDEGLVRYPEFMAQFDTQYVQLINKAYLIVKLFIFFIM